MKSDLDRKQRAVEGDELSRDDHGWIPELKGKETVISQNKSVPYSSRPQMAQWRGTGAKRKKISSTTPQSYRRMCVLRAFSQCQKVLPYQTFVQNQEQAWKRRSEMYLLHRTRLRWMSLHSWKHEEVVSF